jgi:hypothetical protein
MRRNTFRAAPNRWHHGCGTKTHQAGRQAPEKKESLPVTQLNIVPLALKLLPGYEGTVVHSNLADVSVTVSGSGDFPLAALKVLAAAPMTPATRRMDDGSNVFIRLEVEGQVAMTATGVRFKAVMRRSAPQAADETAA